MRGAVGLHAPFTVSDETIAEAADLCARLNSVLHVHLAEDRVDVDDAHARRYAGPLARLAAADALPRGSILAHCVHLDEDEVREAARLGCWIVQNPRSNANNRVGYPRALAASTRVALGTDGFPSDLRAESLALREEAARHGERPEAAAERARAGHTLVAEMFRAVDDECRLAEEGAVEHLSIAGRTVVRAGQLQTGDLDEIRRSAGEAAPRLWRRMVAIP